MATKFLENHVTVHFLNNSYDDSCTEYAKWLDVAEKEGPYQKIDTKNRLKLGEIQLNFAKANALFYQKKFREALKAYRYVQALLFQLLYPPFKPHYVVDLAEAMPAKAELFDSFLEVGAKMTVSLSPENIQSAVGYVSSKSLPADVQKYAQMYDDVGITTADAVSNDVRNASMVGLEYAKSNEWNQAEVLFRQGLAALGNPTTPDGNIAKASIELNLGAVYTQKGNLDLAKQYVTSAGKGFRDCGDKVGQAQSMLNMAAILNKEGKTDEAAAMSKEADALMRTEDKISPGVAGTAPSLVSPSNIGNSKPPSITNIGLSSAPRVSVMLGTTTHPDSIYQLAAQKGNGVVFRLPNKGDGWITQKLEGGVEKGQKVTVKELGVLRGAELLKFKWTDTTGLNLQDLKTNYYEKRVNLTSVEAVKHRYYDLTDWAINLPHLYLYQLPVCIGDCHFYLGEFNQALAQYLQASNYQFINTAIEVPALWIRIARNYLEWGNSLYKNDKVGDATSTYTNVVTLDDKTPVNSPLYKSKLGSYGAQVSTLISSIANPDASPLNPDTKNLVLDVRNRLKMIKAGLDYFGYPASYFPIFKFDFLQSVATYFAQQAIQAEREYINFTSRGEDEQMTREQLQQSVELSSEQVDLAQKQVEYAQAELGVNLENAQLADVRLQNAQQQKAQFANISYEMTALDAAVAFASGPEGYGVSYTYYSPSEGTDVTLSGSDAYKVMEQAAWKKGLLSRQMELSNLDRNIAELNANKNLANAQVNAAQVNVDVAVQQKKIAQMNEQHAEELLNSFESQVFTPELWFQLGYRLLFMSKTYLQRAIGIAKKMQKAYELETGRALNVIKNDYNTNIISGLLSADYLLGDINYFTIDRINNSKSKDIPIKQMYSLSELNPIGFQTTFKNTGKLEFETNLSDFDLAYPGAYLRKIKKVEVIVEGLIPPEGVHGTLKNSGISRDRKQNGTVFYRIQPFETLYLSNYSPRQDVIIFQPDQRVLDVFENCGVATGWTLEIPPAANDINFQTISDVKMIIYYTAQFDSSLETQIKAGLPKTGEKSTAIPFRILFPDEYFTFIDTGELKFTLRDNDFASNETQLKVKNTCVKVVTEGMSAQNLKFSIQQDGTSATSVTDGKGLIKSDQANVANPLNAFIGKQVSKEWIIRLSDADNPGIDRAKVKDLFFFIEYAFTFKGM